jgi:hypothetical protein
MVTMVTESEFQRLQGSADEGDPTISSLVHHILRQFLANEPKT